MAIYAISDLHLSHAAPKPMDIFGPAWENHTEKIRSRWEETVTKADTVLMPGDLSWGMRLSQARPDLDFVASLPGKKILTRGNHDYWWQRQATNRMQRSIDRSLIFLQGTSTVVGDAGITGTRGWRVDWELDERRGDGETGRLGEYQPSTINHQPLTINHPENDRILKRELAYLEKGLQSIPGTVDTRIAMLHYPPFDEKLQPNEFTRILHEYSVDIVVYGHIHLGLGSWLEGDVDGIMYHLVSADIVDFTPRLILP